MVFTIEGFPMNPSTYTEKIYSSVIAGSLPAEKSEALSVVTYAILDILGT